MVFDSRCDGSVAFPDIAGSGRVGGRCPTVGPGATGGGRKSVTETDPGLLAALLALVEPTRREDPESPLCWTTLSTRNLADELTADGHKVGSDTVGRLLHEHGFSLLDMR